MASWLDRATPVDEEPKKKSVLDGNKLKNDPFTAMHVAGVESTAILSENRKAPAWLESATPITEFHSMSDRAGAFAGGVARGAVDAAPLTGALVGGVAGAPGGPVSGGAGMVLGTAIGRSAGQAAEDYFGIPKVEDLPPGLRPWHYAGEAISAGASLSAPVVTAAKFSINTGVRFFDRMTETFARNPKSVVAAESAALAGGGVGEGVGEELFPGNTWARIGTGAVGSVASPMALVPSVAGNVAQGYQSVRAAFSESGRMDRAARELGAVLSEAGSDPATLMAEITRLESQLPRGANMTVGMLTGNNAAMALEAELRRRSAKFARDSDIQAMDALKLLRVSADSLSATGDPQALKLAAEYRQQYFDGLLTGMTGRAESDVRQAVANLPPNSPRTASQMSTRAGEILDTGLTRAREVEREMYAVVPDGPATASNVVDTVNRLRDSELLPEEDVPGLVAAFAKRVSQSVEPGEELGKELVEELVAEAGASSIRELRLLRTRMLAKTREAVANNQFGEAHIYSEIAAAALDDLGALNIPELDAARQFSASLHDHYTRTYAGDALAVGRDGASRLPPEVVLRRATASGIELGAMRFRELREAAEFGDQAAIRLNLTPDQAASEMLDIQEQFLRTMAEDIAPNGVINASRLASFNRRYEEVLEEMPALRDNLASVESASAFMGRTRTREVAYRRLNEKSAFARVSRAENPVAEVGRVLRSTEPEENLRQLYKTSRKDSPEAVAGLQRSIMENVFQASGDSFGRLHSNLFEPKKAGQKSVTQMMQEIGIMTADDVDRLRTLTQQARRIETAIAKNDNLDHLLEQDSALFDIILRIGGANLGSLGATGHGSPLIAASAGSKFARQVLDRVPRANVQSILIEASKNPELMKDLLRRKPSSAKARLRLAQRMHLYLFQSGLIRGPEDLTEGESSQETPAPN